VRLGNSCSLLTVGAVLAFAVHVDLEVVDVATVGWIFMLVAVTGGFVELAVVRPRARAARAGTGPRPAPARPLPRGPQASWASWDTREFTPVPRPPRES
jgi:Domain of unknown function (DUF6458)